MYVTTKFSLATSLHSSAMYTRVVLKKNSGCVECSCTTPLFQCIASLLFRTRVRCLLMPQFLTPERLTVSCLLVVPLGTMRKPQAPPTTRNHSFLHLQIRPLNPAHRLLARLPPRGNPQRMAGSSLLPTSSNRCLARSPNPPTRLIPSSCIPGQRAPP